MLGGCFERRAFGVGEHANEAELVSERILHDRPVDQRTCTLVGVWYGVEGGRVLQTAADPLDLLDRHVDVIDADVHVGSVRCRVDASGDVDCSRVGPLRRRHPVKDDLVPPGRLVLVAQVGKAIGPRRRDA